MLIARIIAVLQMTEPMPFPIAIPTFSCEAMTAFSAPELRIPCPSTAAMVETMISGRVVARLMTVAPMMNFGILVTSATHTAPSTNQSPPLTIRTTPTTNKRYIRTVSITFPP